MEYAEQKGRFGALSARNLVKNLVKFHHEISSGQPDAHCHSRF
jgi:hypothetical protein